jgi:hypothetical protein
MVIPERRGCRFKNDSAIEGEGIEESELRSDMQKRRVAK